MVLKMHAVHDNVTRAWVSIENTALGYASCIIMHTAAHSML